MKPLIYLFFCLLAFQSPLSAQDIYAEYQMSGLNGKTILTKMYFKNGDVRTESKMDIGGRSIDNISLHLKSKPDLTYILNTANKTYTESKGSKGSTKKYTITVIGNEKVGQYNTTHVRMSADGKSWDSWFCKDLPAVNYPMDKEGLDYERMIIEMKAKGISGMMVKISFNKPGTTTATMTMLLVKYEKKALPSSLFTIPAGYSKSAVSIDAEKMKTMSPAERKEMIKKMMEQNRPK